MRCCRTPLQLTAPVSGLIDSMQRGVERQLQQSIDQLRLTRDRLLLLVALAVVAGIGMMSMVILTTVRGMNEVVGVVSRLADGDYTQGIGGQGSDELARAMHALQTMQRKLRAVLSGRQGCSRYGGHRSAPDQLRAPRICRRAPSSRPRASRRPPPRWRR